MSNNVVFPLTPANSPVLTANTPNLRSTFHGREVEVRPFDELWLDERKKSVHEVVTAELNRISQKVNPELGLIESKKWSEMNSIPSILFNTSHITPEQNDPEPTGVQTPRANDSSSSVASSAFSTPASAIVFGTPGSNGRSPESAISAYEEWSDEDDDQELQTAFSSSSTDVPYSTHALQSSAIEAALQKVKDLDQVQSLSVSPPPASAALSLSTPYCLAFIEQVRDSYIFDGISDFPETPQFRRSTSEKSFFNQNTEELNRRFEKLDHSSRMNPYITPKAQKVFNRALFDYIHEAVQESCNKPIVQPNFEGSWIILKPNQPITVGDVAERITLCLKMLNPINCFPLKNAYRANEELNRVCHKYGFKDLYNFYHRNSPMQFADMQYMIKLIDRIEKKGQIAPVNTDESAIPLHTFKPTYLHLMKLREDLRDECNALVNEVDEKDDEIEHEVEEALFTEKSNIVRDIEVHLLDRLLRDEVENLDAIQAKKAARTAERARKIAQFEGIAEALLASLV